MARKKDQLERLIENCLETETENDIHLSYPDIADEAEIVSFYKMERKAYKYARGFFHLLSVHSNVYPAMLPIVFRDNLASIAETVDEKSMTYNPDMFQSGNGWSSNMKQAVIYIGLPRRTTATLASALKKGNKTRIDSLLFVAYGFAKR